MPAGVKPPALSLADWRHTLTHPLLMGMVGVTVLSAAGQFTLFSYFAPYYRQVLGAEAAGVGDLGQRLEARALDRRVHGVARTPGHDVGTGEPWRLSGCEPRTLPSLSVTRRWWASSCGAIASATGVRFSTACPSSFASVAR